MSSKVKRGNSMLGNECSMQFRNLVTVLNKRPQAMAMIKGSEKYPAIKGSAKFFEVPEGVLVAVDVCGLPGKVDKCDNPIFALHIHEGQSCTGNMKETFKNAMMHYNPGNCNHPYHAGDLPPIFGCDGYGFLVAMTDRFFVDEIIGKTIIIHSGVDDFMTQPSGNSGEKIACGEIGIVPQPRNMTYRI